MPAELGEVENSLEEAAKKAVPLEEAVKETVYAALPASLVINC